MKKPVIKGSRGKWTAEYEGQTLPVIHNLRVTRTKGADGVVRAKYSDDFDQVRAGKSAADWVSAFDNPNQWVIVQRGVEDAAGTETRARDGYIGVFKFANLDLKSGLGCDLDLVERIA